MAVPSSGELRLRGDIALEVYGVATGTNISLGDMSDLAEFTAPDQMSDFYGYIATSAPEVTTNAATSVASASMILNGNVTSDGGETVTERGFYFGTNNASPTNNTKYVVSGTTGSYSNTRSSLTANTNYYFWAFATNAKGTTYGSMQTQLTLNVFTPTFAAMRPSESRAANNNNYAENMRGIYKTYYYNPSTASYIENYTSGVWSGGSDATYVYPPNPLQIANNTISKVEFNVYRPTTDMDPDTYAILDITNSADTSNTFQNRSYQAIYSGDLIFTYFSPTSTTTRMRVSYKNQGSSNYKNLGIRFTFEYTPS